MERSSIAAVRVAIWRLPVVFVMVLELLLLASLVSSDSARLDSLKVASLRSQSPSCTTRPARAIVALGDSITHGAHASGPQHAWPAILSARLAAAGTRHTVFNAGISGNRLNNPGGKGPTAVQRLQSDVLSKPNVSYVILLEGVNDIKGGATVHSLIAGYTNIVKRSHAAGLCVYGGTILPFSASPAREAVRQQANDYVKGAGHFDAVIDFAAVMTNPAHPTALKQAYDSGDHLHPNDAGYAAMGNAISLQLF